MLTRFWQTVQLLTLVHSPAGVGSVARPSRSLADLLVWGLPQLAAVAAFLAACQSGTSSQWRALLLVPLPVAVIARVTGA